MRRGGKKHISFKKALGKFKEQINEFTDILTARIISPRLNIPVDEAKVIGSNILNSVKTLKEVDEIYSVGNMMASVRFGEQFNIPVVIKDLNVCKESEVSVSDIGLSIKEDIQVPYGIITVMGGPDAGKSSLANHIADSLGITPIIAMEPIQNPDQPFLIGPSASALGIVSMLYVHDDVLIFDSGRFLRGISDYGLGEKGLPIGLSLFLTDLNNLFVYCKKRCFLVVSTESNREDYNTAYYELMRGAVNGVIQPEVGSQSGLLEMKPANRIPIPYTYGEGANFEAVPNLFKIKQQKLLEEIEDGN